MGLWRPTDHPEPLSVLRWAGLACGTRNSSHPDDFIIFTDVHDAGGRLRPYQGRRSLLQNDTGVRLSDPESHHILPLDHLTFIMAERRSRTVVSRGLIPPIAPYSPASLILS